VLIEGGSRYRQGGGKGRLQVDIARRTMHTRSVEILKISNVSFPSTNRMRDLILRDKTRKKLEERGKERKKRKNEVMERLNGEVRCEARGAQGDVFF